MNREKNIEVVNDESFTLETLFQYVNENFYGLILLAFAFFIVYFVDYISRINALIFAIPTPIPGIQMSTNISSMKPPKVKKFKKIKRH
jgi:hypothetical protein